MMGAEDSGRIMRIMRIHRVVECVMPGELQSLKEDVTCDFQVQVVLSWVSVGVQVRRSGP